jgi:hypothetical protein
MGGTGHSVWRYFPGIQLTELGETKTNVSQNTRSRQIRIGYQAQGKQPIATDLKEKQLVSELNTRRRPNSFPTGVERRYDLSR